MFEKNHGVGLFIVWQNFPVFCQFSTGRCAQSSLGGSPEIFEEAFRNDEPDMEECSMNDSARQQAQSWAFLLKTFPPQRHNFEQHTYEVRKL